MKHLFIADKYDIQGKWIDYYRFRYRHKEAAEVLRARVKGIEITKDLGTSATGYTPMFRWECKYQGVTA